MGALLTGLYIISLAAIILGVFYIAPKNLQKKILEYVGGLDQ
ncbi:hypothetical protein ACFYKX_26410 [Cytobacillus sp. FJAT-54145]|uniref:Uncharacterized protein n=1 Tax=Cytobacillus spartinae TaxID=3299023 RepID=A0ABW6KLI5_9BACI